jgi:hypothetical protein
MEESDSTTVEVGTEVNDNQEKEDTPNEANQENENQEIIESDKSEVVQLQDQKNDETTDEHNPPEYVEDSTVENKDTHFDDKQETNVDAYVVPDEDTTQYENQDYGNDYVVSSFILKCTYSNQNPNIIAWAVTLFPYQGTSSAFLRLIHKPKAILNSHSLKANTLESFKIILMAGLSVIIMVQKVSFPQTMSNEPNNKTLKTM